MTQQPHHRAAHQASASAVPLIRQRREQVGSAEEPHAGQLAGVCAALGQRWQIDPVLIRTVVVLAALSGGVGIVLYAALWLWLPPADGRASLISQALPAWAGWSTAKVMVVAALVAGLVMIPLLQISPFNITPLVVVLVLIAIGRNHTRKQRQREELLRQVARWHPPSSEFGQAVVAWQTRLQQVTTGQPAAMVAHPTTGQYSSTVHPPVPPHTVVASPMPLAMASPTSRPASRRRTKARVAPRSRASWWITLLTVALAQLVWLVCTFGLHTTPVVALSAALAVVALALVIGGFAGRPRLIVALGLIVSLALTPVGWVSSRAPGPLATNQVWTSPNQISDVNLRGQAAQIDLSSVVLGHDQTMRASGRASALELVLPKNQAVTVTYRLAPGTLSADKRSDAVSNGVGFGSVAGRDQGSVDLGPSTGPRLTIVLDLVWSTAVLT